ncbi:macro domain-containing protein [uncultured Tenacibaculum sp.]|uniref:macro domain-containing protein n=1 Tax=uncultured Tenacibaculum sp. TaxID=174713 RepID=UPI00261EEBFE|nr:macro domain-containing protein [uncultured Tenacibaculum sp.]
MNKIKYIKGNATKPIGNENKIIVHICNDIGGWGKGFVLAISKKWKKPEEEYREWYKSEESFKLGAVQFVKVENNLWVANLIGQHKIRKDSTGTPPIRYKAIEQGLKKVQEKAKELNASVHMPRIGCGLAGGSWDKIEPIINKELSHHEIPITVYDFD